MIKWLCWLEMTWQLKNDVRPNLIEDFNEHSVRSLNNLPIKSFITTIITDVNHIKDILGIVNSIYIINRYRLCQIYEKIQRKCYFFDQKKKQTNGLDFI